jgi:hypothetical protein
MREPSCDLTRALLDAPPGDGYYPAQYRDDIDATYGTSRNLSQISRHRLQCRSRRRRAAERSRGPRSPAFTLRAEAMPDHADVSEFPLRILMQMPASLFVISNAVRHG